MCDNKVGVKDELELLKSTRLKGEKSRHDNFLVKFHSVSACVCFGEEGDEHNLDRLRVELAELREKGPNQKLSDR